MKAWEAEHGRIPAGSVVMVRSDWSKRWTDDPVAAKALAADPNFPSVALDTLKFLHLQRHILFHGHEPLDTDTTPTLEGESWLMHHGYAQAEGVANLAGVPATGCLVSFGFPKFKGGLGGYARYVAICPPSTEKGVTASRRTHRCRPSRAPCTGTSTSATGSADPTAEGAPRGAPSAPVGCVALRIDHPNGLQTRWAPGRPSSTTRDNPSPRLKESNG